MGSSAKRRRANGRERKPRIIAPKLSKREASRGERRAGANLNFDRGSAIFQNNLKSKTRKEQVLNAINYK